MSDRDKAIAAIESVWGKMGTDWEDDGLVEAVAKAIESARKAERQLCNDEVVACLI